MDFEELIFKRAISDVPCSCDGEGAGVFDKMWKSMPGDIVSAGMEVISDPVKCLIRKVLALQSRVCKVGYIEYVRLHPVWGPLILTAT